MFSESDVENIKPLGLNKQKKTDKKTQLFFTELNIFFLSLTVLLIDQLGGMCRGSKGQIYT